ncbi:hypothetical protein ACIQAL_23495 [Pseudomonas sp. NPDC088368]|jgi:hypothetical protein|uniref:hypothetical protein n=1 Tax=Pseudomonas sp. NPDC088368 TaxID=3364453 RepID=UPI00381D01FE
MYSKISLIFLAALTLTSVHAQEQMQFDGEIKNFLSREVSVVYPSWDVGAYEPEDLIVEPDEHVKFRFSAHPHRAEIGFALTGGAGKDRVLCLYDLRYGNRSFVQGAIKLTGPHVWPQGRSIGNTPATCSAEVIDWDYEKSMNVLFLIE